MILPLLLLPGCSLFGSKPDVTGISPAVVMPGDAIEIAGAQLDEEVEGELVQGATVVPLPVDVVSDALATTTVPDDLASGTWTLRLVRSGRHGEDRTLDVWRVDTEPACDKRYAIDVETSRTHRSVTVERIFRDRAPTRDTFAGDELAAIEPTTTVTRDGGTCRALWLRLASGDRVLIADDTSRDLAQVAAELSTTLDVPITPAAVPASAP